MYDSKDYLSKYLSDIDIEADPPPPCFNIEHKNKGKTKKGKTGKMKKDKFI